MVRVITLTHRSQEFKADGEDYYDLHSFFGSELAVDVDGSGFFDEKVFFAIEKRMSNELNVDLERVALAKFLSDILIDARQSLEIEDDYLNKPVLVIAASNSDILDNIKKTTRPYLLKPMEYCFHSASELIEDDEDDNPSFDGLVKRLLSLCIALSGFYKIKTLDLNEDENQKAFQALTNRADKAMEYANIIEMTKDVEDNEDFPQLVSNVDKKILEFFETSDKPADCIRSISYNPTVEAVVVEHMDVMVYKTTTIQ